jgi:type VI secretion system secreted protein VgrG
MLVIAGIVVAIILGVSVAFKSEITRAVATLTARVRCGAAGAVGCDGASVSLAAPPGTNTNAYGLVSAAPGGSAASAGSAAPGGSAASAGSAASGGSAVSGGSAKSGGSAPGGSTATGTPTLPPGSGTATGTPTLPPGSGTATGTPTLPPGSGTATGTPTIPPGGVRSGGLPGVSAGLGDGVDAVINSSAVFKGNALIIARNGYHVTFGDEGKGSFCNRTKKLIVIDSKWKGNDAVIADILAHEMGHAIYDPKHDPTPKMDDPKFADWILTQVQKSLDDEGEAILKEFQIRESLVAGGQPPIPISGVKAADYEKIWQQFQKDRNREKARRAIGAIVGKYEHPSTAPEMTYEGYYASAWMDASAAQTGINLSGVR